MTSSTIKEDFLWKHINDDMNYFVSVFPHYFISHAGKVFPRPVGSALHGSCPNEVIQVEYIYIWKADRREIIYVSIIRDDFNFYLLL